MFFLKKIMEPIVFNGDPTVQIDRQPAFARSGSKIKIYPVQAKTYTQLTNSFSSVASAPSENYEKANLQPNLSTVEDLSIMNFEESKESSSSNKYNPNTYTNIRNSELESSSLMFKTARTSPDGDDSKETRDNKK